MNISQESDETIMARVACGEYDGMEHLVKRYANPLMTLIRRMAGDPDRSEDLFQEAFLAVWKNRKSYKYPQPFKLWLFKIAVNLYRAQFRLRYLHTFSLTGEDWSEPPAVGDPPPLDTAIAMETARLIEEQVRQLPAQQRAVVVLRIWNGLSYSEISKVIGRREGTVRSNMHHALLSLREYLEPRMK